MAKHTSPTKPTEKKPQQTQRADVLGSLRELAAPEEIIEAACRLGAIQRQRKVDLPALVEATVAAVLPTPGVQTTAFANYIALTGQQLAPSTFYERFSPAFAQLMREVALRAVEGVRRVAPEDKGLNDYGVLLEHFKDVQVADATSQLLKRLARHWAPSTHQDRPAGIKWHAVVSLRDGLPVADRLTEQRVQDTRALPDEALQPGTLTLMDLGYVDTARFIAADARGAHYLTRLKTSHNPCVVRVHVGRGERQRVRGMRLDDALTQGVLRDDAGALDVDVQLEKGGEKALARVCALLAPDGDFHWYLTNVPRDVLGPDDVAAAYRVRWYVELLFKQLKSGAGLKAIQASRPGAVMALLYAKVTALALARLLELSVQEKHGDAVRGQLALVLALTRCAPLLLSGMMMSRGVTLAQLEERILLIASITARSRNQRRERARRKRESELGLTR